MLAATVDDDGVGGGSNGFCDSLRLSVILVVLFDEIMALSLGFKSEVFFIFFGIVKPDFRSIFFMSFDDVGTAKKKRRVLNKYIRIIQILLMFISMEKLNILQIR